MTRMPKLHQILRDELQLQTRHCQLLEAQQSALLDCDRARFRALQNDYTLLLAALDVQEAARQAALCDAHGTPATLSALLLTLPEPARRRLQPLRDGLRQTLDRVQTLNRQNQRLIENELDYIAFSLELFIEAGRKGEGTGVGQLLLDHRA